MAENSYERKTNMGRALIFCNIKFDNPDDSRKVAELDVDELENLLPSLGFDVKTFLDKTKSEITQILEKEAAADQKDNTCFLCVLSSHGETYETGHGVMEDVYLCRDGGFISVKSMLHIFNNDNMKDMPKIFLLQLCRGSRVQESMNISIDTNTREVRSAVQQEFPGSSNDPFSDNQSYLIPVKRDFFLHYATVPGHVSYKRGLARDNSRAGTVFLEAWCKVLKKEENNREIHDLATKVNAIVCERFESNVPSKAAEGLHMRRQSPQMISMLTRDFYLPMPTFRRMASDLGVNFTSEPSH